MVNDLFKSWLVERYIAHRGLHNEIFPENSLGAIENAIKESTPIEIDVQEIADGTLVIFHDKSLQRMTGQDGYVMNLTAEDLPSHKLLGTEFSIPTLEEVLALVNGQIPILFELKNDGKVGSLEKKFLEVIQNYQGEFAIQSFNPMTLEWYKNHAPNIIRGQISSFFKKEKMSGFKKYFLKKMAFHKICKPHFIAYNFHDLPNRWVNKHKDLPLLAWTIKSQEEYNKILPYCDNILFEGFEPRV